MQPTQKHALRARIVLHSADRLSVAEVARRAGVGRPAVWRWQWRYALAGVDGLLRDASRTLGKAPTPEATVQKVVALTCAEPPGETTRPSCATSNWTSWRAARPTSAPCSSRTPAAPAVRVRSV